MHPVVNLKVGPYEQNKTQHRLCEMHQDVYIFDHVGLGEINTAEYIKRAGIASCSDEHGDLDSAIVDLWLHCLRQIPTGIEVKKGIKGPIGHPDPRRWHKSFVSVIDGIAEEGGRLPPLSRHFAEAVALVYPDISAIKGDFIENLRTPEGAIEHYNTVFSRTQDKVKQIWEQLGGAITQATPEAFVLGNADLDTGMDMSGHFLFWSVQA